MILGQKLTINYSSLMDEREETRVLTTTHKREREKKYGPNKGFYLLYLKDENFWVDILA